MDKERNDEKFHLLFQQHASVIYILFLICATVLESLYNIREFGFRMKNVLLTR